MKEVFPAIYKGIIASMTVNVLKAEPVAVLTEDDDVLIITEYERKAVLNSIYGQQQEMSEDATKSR